MNCNSSKVYSNNDYSKKIDTLIQTKNPRSFNGVILISENGQTKYQKAYGFSDFENRTPMKLNGHFSTMSLAKQITATLVMMEVEKGNINLNAPINTYLKDLDFKWANKVTVHHLLNNSSGIDAWKLKENLLFEPGTQFKYSNIGYATLGKILGKVTGKSYEELVTNLFRRCEMTNSYYPNSINDKFLIKGYSVSKENKFTKINEIPFPKEIFPGSHLIVTAKDLVRWNDCLHNGKLLKNENYQKMIHYSIKNQHSLFSENEIGYGYGLRINDEVKGKEFGHTGFSPAAGFTAVNLYYPSKKLSVIVLENQATENFDIAYYFESEIRKIVLKNNLLK